MKPAYRHKTPNIITVVETRVHGSLATAGQSPYAVPAVATFSPND